jgi:hypothetical protein
MLLPTGRQAEGNRPACPLSVPAPRLQVVDLIDLVIRDAGEGVGQPSMQIYGTEIGRFGQDVGEGCGLPTCFGTDEEVIFAAEGDGAHAAFGGVVVEFDDAVVEVGTQAFPSAQCVSDCSSRRGFALDCG